MSQRSVTFDEETPEVFEYEPTELPEIKKKDEQSEERKAWFMDFMSVSMGIRAPQKVLGEVSFRGVADLLASGKVANVITMAGAGISTSAGIPDYRSPGFGMFDQLKKQYPEVVHVTDLFNIQFFLKHPEPFFDRSRIFFENALKPTPCHYFIRLLHEKGLLLRHYTQNIDTLERRAGLPPEMVVEAHGTFSTAHCMDCDTQYAFDWMEDRIFRDPIPKCDEKGCTGVVKPDIVMYGESLDNRFAQLSEEDTLKCDLLIVMGTALAVQPFSILTSKVRTSTPRLYINLDRGSTSSKHPMSAVMFGASFDFDAEDNYRDVFKQEKCDTAAYEMAEILGWKDELSSLVETEHARWDAEAKAKGKVLPSPLEKPTPEFPALDAAPAGENSDGGKTSETHDAPPTVKLSPGASATLLAAKNKDSESKHRATKKSPDPPGQAKPGTGMAAKTAGASAPGKAGVGSGSTPKGGAKDMSGDKGARKPMKKTAATTDTAKRRVSNPGARK